MTGVISDTDEGIGMAGQRGVLALQGIEQNTLTDITRIHFAGLDQSLHFVFDRVERDVKVPPVWRGVNPNANIDDDNDEGLDGTVAIEETLTLWYGEELNGGIGSAFLLVDSIGNTFGSISDGTYSYTVSSCLDTTVAGCNASATTSPFRAVAIRDLPEEHSELQTDTTPDGSRQLHSVSLRGADSVTPSRHSEKDTIKDRSDGWNGRKMQQQSSNSPVVDVLVKYTTAAKLSEGGTENIQALISLGIVQTNVALAKSGSDVRINLIGSLEETAFPDDGTADPWVALQSPDSGYFDDVDSLRDEMAADIVILVADYANGWCGISNPGGPLAVVARLCATGAGKYSFAHAIGHQLVSSKEKQKR